MLALMVGLGANAQIEKGKNFLQGTGTLGITHTTFNSTILNFGLSAGGGRFVNDRIAVGAKINGSIIHSNLSNTSSTFTSVGAGLFGCYYKPMMDKLYFTTQLDVSGNRNTTMFTNSQLFGSVNYSLNTRIQPGFTYFPTERLGIDLKVGAISWNRYWQDHRLVARETITDEFNMTLLGSFGLGVTYLLK